ncbi:MAG TPA: methyltransferase [Acidobacteriaceae bacterium]|nr:methyltransferase [Acidobacteriaceae bacterium]
MATSDAPTAQITPERLMQMAWGYAPPLAVEAAVRLGVFDALEKGSKTVDELATATESSRRGLVAVLDLLAGLGLLAKSSGNNYALTPESAAFLVSTKPSFQGGLFRHMSRQLLPNWLHLTEVVRSGKPAESVNDEKEGTAFFQELVEDIFPMSYSAARGLAEGLGISGGSQEVSVLDLAAGSGVWGIALAQRWPQVRVRAVDWEGVLPVTRRVAEKFGVADRFTFVPGDLLKADFGTDHQVAVLGHILHSEGVKRSQLLLKKTFQALAPGGTIAIAEFLVNDMRTGPANGLIFAVNMLVNTTEGGTYSFTEIQDWLKEAGFTNIRQMDSPGPSPLILADRPA